MRDALQCFGELSGKRGDGSGAVELARLETSHQVRATLLSDLGIDVLLFEQLTDAEDDRFAFAIFKNRRR